MKKKLILSVICSILLSFGAMAKSHLSTKIKKVESKIHDTNIRMSKKTKMQNCSCHVVWLSCGARGFACGDTFAELADAIMQAERAFC
jgi:hypothetical protein